MDFPVLAEKVISFLTIMSPELARMFIAKAGSVKAINIRYHPDPNRNPASTAVVALGFCRVYREAISGGVPLQTQAAFVRSTKFWEIARPRAAPVDWK
jgi:hypothetical protein